MAVDGLGEPASQFFPGGHAGGAELPAEVTGDRTQAAAHLEAAEEVAQLVVGLGEEVFAHIL